MPLSMYQASVPVFTRALNNLSHVLDKGAALSRILEVKAIEEISRVKLTPEGKPEEFAALGSRVRAQLEALLKGE